MNKFCTKAVTVSNRDLLFTGVWFNLHTLGSTSYPGTPAAGCVAPRPADLL